MNQPRRPGTLGWSNKEGAPKGSCLRSSVRGTPESEERIEVLMHSFLGSSARIRMGIMPSFFGSGTAEVTKGVSFFGPWPAPTECKA